MQCSRFRICFPVLVILGSFVVLSESQRSFRGSSAHIAALRTGQAVSNLTASRARMAALSTTLGGRRSQDRNTASTRAPADPNAPVLSRTQSQISPGHSGALAARESSTALTRVNGQNLAGASPAATHRPSDSPVRSRTVNPASAKISRPIASRISAASSRESSRKLHGTAQDNSRTPARQSYAASSTVNRGFHSNVGGRSLSPQEKNPASTQGSKLSPVRASLLASGSLRTRLTASTSQLRNRQIARQTPGRRAPSRRLIGANVCGRQCCSGWTVSPGTNRCIKPVCDPPCQNRGSCSRPQLCVCRSGFQGSRCEEIVPEQPYIPRAFSSRSFSSRSSALHSNIFPRIESNAKNNTKITSEASARHKASPVGQSFVTQHRQGQHGSTQQSSGTSRTVKHLSNGNGQLLSNALFNGNGQTSVQNHYRANGQVLAENKNALPRGGNLTTSIGTIKIVFTPTICKRQCINGKCYNNCKKGDPTTLYSENGYGPVSKSGFRIYFCQIPCLNGGYCIGRDKCRCPSNSTGKFCHLPVPPEKQTVSKTVPVRSSDSQSVYTLPLSNQQVLMLPSLVNIHVNHPPEATVQIHQVARVKNAPDASTTNSIKISQGQQSAHSVQQRSQLNADGNINEQPQPQHRPMNVGRCFQETADGQCGKPLPGLTKQDDCCGSVGISWGYHKCTKCPPKPEHPKIHNGQVECPLGYKKMNQTNCKDINECLMSGMCKNANCLNTRGSYRCTCKPGYMLDTSRSHCISDKAVSVEKGTCFRSLSRRNCSLPLSQQITKQICCCSRVGKGWGRNCEKCPLPGSVVFNEICPAGHGYHYSRSHIQISVRPAEEHELAQITSEQYLDSQQSTIKDSDLTSKEKNEDVRLEGYDTTIKAPQQPQPFAPAHVPRVDAYPVEVVVKTSPPTLVHVVPESTARQVASVFATEISVINVCDVSPNICGPGLCINQQVGYLCKCDSGYQLDNQQTKCVDTDECREVPQLCSYGQCENTVGGYRCICSTGFVLNQQGTDCIDINECELEPCEGKGHCINTVGTYSCSCFSGYTLVSLEDKQSCQDINECAQANLCRRGHCTNTPGSYRCDCEVGYMMTRSGQCNDIDECRSPNTCPTGECINTMGSFQCVSCSTGYRAINGKCLDENECLSFAVCANGNCINMDGSYKCICNQGFEPVTDLKSCRDIDECVSPDVCFNGLCTNTEGSYTCSSCNSGYRVSEDRDKCEDMNECLSKGICGPNGECTNIEGSYFCICARGFENTPDGTGCQDINECLARDICGPNGECINNEAGSYYCLCAQGYTTTADGTGCEDVNECSEEAKCSGGQCINTDGSYMCRCETGFTHLPEAEQCIDIDECSLYGSSVCGTWKCENTVGSYQCIVGCQPGFQRTAIGECIDIDECINGTICGTHGYCENTDGSFRCHCDQGFEVPPRGQGCVDIDECAMMNGVCGTALCENFEGSFFCECMDENEDFDPARGQCRPRIAMEETPGVSIVPELPRMSAPAKGDLKECYYNLNDENFCDNLLSRNITKEECCCTVGVGWGDNCEVHPCPIINTDEYNEICPDGKGFIPFQIGSFSFGSQNYGDADECAMFGSEICKNGHCVNNIGDYACYCGTGFYYDNVRLECVDIDECQDENTCVNGECVNTPGAFNCFCSPPLTLDVTRKRCINGTESGVDSEEVDTYLDVCWQGVTEDDICSKPLRTRSTTYTECCCLYGEAWGLQCAFCPSRTSDDFAQLCNIPRIFGDVSTGLHDRPGYEYGPETPSYGQDFQLGIGSDDNYLQPEYRPYDSQRELEYGPVNPYLGPRFESRDPQPGSVYELRDPHLTPQYGLTDPRFGEGYGSRNPQPGPEYGSRGDSRTPQYSPRQPGRVPLFSSSDNDRSSSFEGLQAEECGILNGCENGRCVRVEEGYTCDCFDGFELDMTKMTCVDINECEDLSDSILCRNASCENTEGSYKCNCLPGYMFSQYPNDCVPETEARQH
ncbi:latent-transforming growth factor beta-binding protein 2-like [Scyliorhinus canicula]|uniref:latent-transforming growth factor beta-binding protein 2-like n=1 Tax=Scyliorhinus canicula TaxID=7830 RepID=UPI0018F66239|nr:latent-transforming growth factor beta-binding protein 2-like [Scyliorhinus canicula]